MQVLSRNGRPTCLELAGRLRLQRNSAGQIVVSTREADGRWKRSAGLEAAPLLQPTHLTNRAIMQSVEATLAEASLPAGLGTADRGYAEKRIRTDLYPDAGGVRTARAIRAVIMRDIALPRMLRATCLVFGASASIRNYNDMVRAGGTVLAQIADELPNLAPVLSRHVQRLARKGEPMATLGLLGEARAELMQTGDSGRLARRDWKWLSHQSNSTVRRLLTPSQEGDELFRPGGRSGFSPRRKSPAHRRYWSAWPPPAARLRAPSRWYAKAAAWAALKTSQGCCVWRRSNGADAPHKASRYASCAMTWTT